MCVAPGRRVVDDGAAWTEVVVVATVSGWAGFDAPLKAAAATRLAAARKSAPTITLTAILRSRRRARLLCRRSRISLVEGSRGGLLAIFRV